LHGAKGDAREIILVKSGWRHPRITVTSHVAAFASRPAWARHVAAALAAYRRGEELPHCYQPECGY
jgi:glyoxylate/hydroxypyruvate reductase A